MVRAKDYGILPFLCCIANLNMLLCKQTRCRWHLAYIDWPQSKSSDPLHLQLGN